MRGASLWNQMIYPLMGGAGQWSKELAEIRLDLVQKLSA
tara:strand:- start:832 stop:948 length:117 start_codon:yes stop_codon:yes gene_type:complete